MRQLALVAHNHMKPAMHDFIIQYGEILRKFRVTGTETTMSICMREWKDKEGVSSFLADNKRLRSVGPPLPRKEIDFLNTN